MEKPSPNHSPLNWAYDPKTGMNVRIDYLPHDATMRERIEQDVRRLQPSLTQAVLMLVSAVNQNTEALLALADAQAGVEEEADEQQSQYLD